MKITFESFFWFSFYGALFSGLFVSYVPQLGFMNWVIVLWVIAITILLTFHAYSRGNGISAENKYIIILLLYFISFALVTSLFNGIDFKSIIIGIKNNFQFALLILFLAILPFKKDFANRLIKMSLLVALIQPIIAILQYKFVVPNVSLNREYVTSSVLDSVNGSFGVNYEGGGTGVMAVFMSIVLCGIFAAYVNGKIAKKTLFLLSLYLLIPMVLSETKVAIFFWGVGILVLLFVSRGENFYRKLTLAPFGILLILLLTVATIEIMMGYGKDLNEIIIDTISYNFGDRGYGQNILNRTTVLWFWYKENINNSFHLLFGYGIDSTQSGDTGVGIGGEVGLKYYGYGVGLTTISRSLWEYGILGTTLFLSVLSYSSIKAYKIARQRLHDIPIKVVAASVFTGNMIIFITFFYNDMIRTSQPGNYIYYLMIAIPFYLKRFRST